MKLGIIGTGQMGSLLATSFIRSGALLPSRLIVTNRTAEKASRLKQQHPALQVAESADEVVKQADIVFLCTRPLDLYSLLQTVRKKWRDNQLAISITSPITVPQLEQAVPCGVARVIPSIVNQSLSGSTLVTFGSRINQRQRKNLLQLLSHISKPIVIDEPITRVASDISSCGPAFLSFLFEKMIDAAAKTTKITKEQATELITEMVIGMGHLFEEKTYTLASLREKVTVKGGVTGVGIGVLESECGEMFEHLFNQTQEKFLDDHRKIDQQFK